MLTSPACAREGAFRDHAGVDDEALPACYRHPDRPTGLSCVECGRPICPDCMRQGPVGQRCPDCAERGRPKVIRPRAVAGGRPIGTLALIGLCVVMFLLQGAALGSQSTGALVSAGALRGVDIANGDYRGLVLAMFLHGSILHLVFNMWALWVLGPVLELRYGTPRFLALYFVSGLWGAAGALALTDASTPVVGASGAIFGLMAGAFVVERRLRIPLLSGVGAWILLNLVMTFMIPNISVGGHIGGLLGGAVATIAIEALSRRGRANRIAETLVLAGLGILAIAVSIAVAG